MPGRIVKQEGKRVTDDLNQIELPDPILEEFKRLNNRISALEEKTGIHSCKYSIVTNVYDNPYKKQDKKADDTAK